MIIGPLIFCGDIQSDIARAAASCLRGFGKAGELDDRNTSLSLVGSWMVSSSQDLLSNETAPYLH